MGIFDFSDFLLLMTLSCTNQGDISSMFPLVFLFVSLLVEFLIFFAVFPLFVFLCWCWLLLITLERLPLVLPRDSVWLVELSLLFVFLFELEVVLVRLEPRIILLIKTGKWQADRTYSILAACWRRIAAQPPSSPHWTATWWRAGFVRRKFPANKLSVINPVWRKLSARHSLERLIKGGWWYHHARSLNFTYYFIEGGGAGVSFRG